MGSSIRIEVFVQPKAGRTELAGMHDGHPKIRLAAPPVDAPTPLAHRLEDLSAAELTKRLAAVGVRITDASRENRSERDGEWLELSFKGSSDRGKLEYMSSAGARIYLQKQIEAGDRPLSYASAGTVAVIASGSLSSGSTRSRNKRSASASR